MAAVAKEAGVKAEAVSAHFQTPQEILVALAADDLAAVARASEQAAKTEIAPQPTSLRKKPILPSQLEQVMADVAPNGGKDVMSGTMARLERRMQVIEKAVTDVADRQEKQVRDRSNAISSVEESITAMLTRMDASEKQNAALVDGLRSAVSKVTSRLAELEVPAPVAAPTPVPALTPVTPPTTSDVKSPLPVSTLASSAATLTADTATAALAPLPAAVPETKSDTTSELLTLPALDTLIAAPKEKLGQAPEANPASLEDSYLTNARRAALAAAERESAKAKTLAETRARTTSRGKFLLFACLAPVVIIGTAIMVLNRNAVTAEPAPIAEAPESSQTVAALEAPPAITAPIEPATTAPSQTPETPPAPQAAAPVPPNPVAATPLASPPATASQTAATPEMPAVLSRESIADLTKAAATGDVRAMRDAGLKYLAGDGVATDETEAARWLLRASYKGEPIAEYWLATLYVRGRGVPADAFQANHWYEAAAKQGNRSAMHNLALNKWQGIGGDKNDEQAARWFKAAAELGYVDSEFNLAVLYERGQGVPQNFTEAYMWYAVAAARGDKEAESRLVVLATHMQPADLAAGQAAAAAFKPKPMDQTANLIATAPSSGG